MTFASFTFLDSSWPYLLAAFLAMVLGPVIYRLSARVPPLLSALDGFVLVSVGGLVFCVLLPDAVAEAGAAVLLAALLGMAIPTLVERFGGVSHGRVHAIGLLLALLGLFFHTVLDGAALASGEDTHDHQGILALAVVLHRLPVGMIVWWLVRPNYGLTKAVAGIAFIVFGTFCGVLLRATPVFDAGGDVFAWFQALVTGTLVHVVLHGTGIGTQKGTHSTSFAEGAGGAVGFGILLLVVTHHHNAPLETFSRMFWDIVEAGFIALICGRVLRVGLTKWRQARQWNLPENLLAVDAMLLAFVFMGTGTGAILAISTLAAGSWIYLRQKRLGADAAQTAGLSPDAATGEKDELVWMFFALCLLAWVCSTGPVDFLMVHVGWRFVLPICGIVLGVLIPASLWVSVVVGVSLWVGGGSYAVALGFLLTRVRGVMLTGPGGQNPNARWPDLFSVAILYVVCLLLTWGGAIEAASPSLRVELSSFASVGHNAHHSFEFLKWCLCYVFVWLGWGPRGFIAPLVRIVERGLEFGREHSHGHTHTKADEATLNEDPHA